VKFKESSIGHIICDLFQARPPADYEGKQLACSAANEYYGTKVRLEIMHLFRSYCFMIINIGYGCFMSEENLVHVFFWDT